MRTFISKIKNPGEDKLSIRTISGLLLLSKTCIESWEDNDEEDKKEFAVKIRLISGRIIKISEEEFIRIWGLKKEEKA